MKKIIALILSLTFYSSLSWSFCGKRKEIIRYSTPLLAEASKLGHEVTAIDHKMPFRFQVLRLANAIYELSDASTQWFRSCGYLQNFAIAVDSELSVTISMFQRLSIDNQQIFIHYIQNLEKQNYLLQNIFEN